MRIINLILLLWFSFNYLAYSQTKGAILLNNDSLTSKKIQNLTVSLNTNNRLALVIGNADYTKAKLKNPINDAEAICDVLKSNGFKVIYKHNIYTHDIDTILRDFGDSVIQNNGVNLFYYSGHGMQYAGENYFLPIDADLKDLNDIQLLNTKLKYIMDKMNSAQRALNIIILDACRTTPFENLRNTLKQGLSDIDNCPINTSVFYATRPNKVAYDGNGKNSPFTEAFLNHIKNDSLEFYEIARRVTRDVLVKTNQEQCPVLLGMSYDPFYFKQKPYRKPNLFIVSVGISHYDGLRDLRYGSKSAYDFDVLMQKAAFDDGTYNTVNRFVLSNTEATKLNILRLVNAVKEKIQEGDVLLFYYNGWILKTQTNKPFVIPFDGNFNDIANTGLPCDYLFSLLTQLPCKSVLFLDKVGESAHKVAETVDENDSSLVRHLSEKDATFDFIKELNSPANNVVVITSIGNNELAYESDEFQSTVFLYCLKTAIESSLKAKGFVDIQSFASDMESITDLTKGLQVLKASFPKGWLNFTLFKK